nr:hypothetical protein BaRGS_001680 [Batillaria attramentaria]
MAPTTCDSFDKCDEAKATEGAAAANSTSHPCQQTYTVDDEPGPFYGMFSSRDFEPEAEWTAKVFQVGEEVSFIFRPNIIVVIIFVLFRQNHLQNKSRWFLKKDVDAVHAQ